MKFFSFLAALVITLGITTQAKGSIENNEDLFSYNKEQVTERFDEANQLEQLVLNKGYDIFTEEVNSDFSNLELSSFDLMHYNDGPMGIPSFWWGFCFSVTGIGIVYLITEDKDETMNALKGCAVSTVAYTGCYIIYYVAIFSSI